MHADEVVAEEGVGERVAREDAARRVVARLRFSVDLLEDRLLGDIGPRHLRAAVLERDAPLGVVVGHDEIGLRAIDRALVGAKQQALALATALLDAVEDALVSILAEVARAAGHKRRQHGGEAGGDRALLDDHAVLELRRAA